MNPESAASKISPERLKKYADFVEVHSDLQPDSTLVYNPEKALVGLLSILTPDPKGIVLAGMEDEVIYSTGGQLYQQTLSFLGRMGISRRGFPMTSTAPWQYCERRDSTGMNVEGSLVKIGAVVREVALHEGLETFGYMRSEAGRNLGIPLIFQGIEFVNQARESGIPHKYDSLWRILGGLQSPNDKRRPSTIYEIIEYLVRNPGVHSLRNVCRGLGWRVGRSQEIKISLALKSLGAAGIINYDSPLEEVKGKRGTGWARYKVSEPERLEDLDKLYTDIRNKINAFHEHSYFLKVTQFIIKNPNTEFSVGELRYRFPEITPTGFQHTLRVLDEVGVIKRVHDGYIGKEIHTKASSNDITRMFYDLVLVPVREEAFLLSPLPIKVPSKARISEFLQNYEEEKSRIGPQGGEEIRGRILSILGIHGELKSSQVVQETNKGSKIELKPHSIRSQIRNLFSLGIIEKTKTGFYRLKEA